MLKKSLQNILKKAKSRPRQFSKRLMVRSLAIVIIPLISLQVIAFLFFYDNHWRSVSQNLAQSVKGEMISNIYLIKKHPEVFSLYQEVYEKSLATRLEYYPNNVLVLEIDRQSETSSQLFGIPLGSGFTKLLNYDSVLKRSKRNNRLFVYQVQLEEGVIEMIFSDKRLVSPTIATFLAWLIVSFFAMMIISVYFLRLQLRPILTLAKSARQIGQGKIVKYIPVVGAYEIRTAISSFNQMYRRLFELNKHQQSMLQALSHDIRAPLARLRVMCSFLDKKEERNDFQNDIEFIDNMLKQYVDYIATENNEELSKVNFISDLTSICELYKNQLDIRINVKNKKLLIKVRKNAIDRLISNLLDNSAKYAKMVYVSIITENNYLKIIIEDDGPGIPSGLRKKVLLPFYRIDMARTPDSSHSIGLGLALCQGIVEQHRGQILLSSSKKIGGLKVSVRIPLNLSDNS